MGRMITPEIPENIHLMLKATPLFLTNQLVMAVSRGTARAVLIPVPNNNPPDQKKGPVGH